MSKVTVKYLKTGKIREMQKRYADPLVKMKIVTYLTRDITEAPVFKFEPGQPVAPQMDFGSDDLTLDPEPADETAGSPRPRGRRRSVATTMSDDAAPVADEPQE